MSGPITDQKIFMKSTGHGVVFSETNYRDYTLKRSIIDEKRWKLIFTLENKQIEHFQLQS